MTCRRAAAFIGPTAAVFLVALAVLPASARARDAFPLVNRAVEVRRSLCFAGRQDILMPVQGVRIVADELQGGGRLRMTYRLPDAAAGRVVVDDGLLMRQWEQPRHLILVERSRAESPSARRRMLALLRRNYRCVSLRGASVNGLVCDVVRVSPRPGHAGPSRLLWIERGRHAILRTEEYDGAGRRRYLSFFEAFRYVPPPAPGAFALPTGVPVCRVRQPMKEQSDFRAAFATAGLAGRTPAWLPAGYALIGCAACARPGGAVLMRYGDGLETLSVLEAPIGGMSPPPPRAGRQAWARDVPPLRITVVGDDTLPPGLGRELLQALDPRSEAALRRGLAARFGPSASALAARLRRRGWGYDRVAALCLGRQSPDTPAHLEQRARRWIALTLGNHSDHAR